MSTPTRTRQGSLGAPGLHRPQRRFYPGLAQRMSAGTGILHSEKNDPWRLLGGSEHRDRVHFVQMWVVPDEGGIVPGHEQHEIGDGVRFTAAGGQRVTASAAGQREGRRCDQQ